MPATTNQAEPTNGHANGAPPASDAALKQFLELCNNMVFTRSQLFRQFMDPRRNIDDECGYPKGTLNYKSQEYQDLYERFAIATRVVQLMPKECWQVQPLVFEDNDAETETEFEKAWDELDNGLRGGSLYQDEEGSVVWEYLHRLDEQSGIGTFGLMLMGFNDGKLLQEPVEGSPPDGNPQEVKPEVDRGRAPSGEIIPGASVPADTRPLGDTSKDIYGPNNPIGSLSAVMGTDAQYQGVQFTGLGPNPPKTKKLELRFLRIFAEHLVQIVQYEANMNNPRYGQPIMYLVTLNDPRMVSSGIGLQHITMRIHWSRVIHACDNLSSSEIFGNPRMRPVLNHLLDLRKIFGASAEGYWKSCFTGISFETDPALGGDVRINTGAMKDSVENYMNGLQRYLSLQGMTAKTLAPSVVDPTPHIKVHLEAIALQLGCPMRVFMGSERGELASSQDDASWNDRIRFRQRGYVTPRIIVPFIDMMILYGILPTPKGYSVEWPDLDSVNDKDKAQIASTMTNAISRYVQGSGESLIPPMEYMTKVLGWSEEDAESVLNEQAKQLEDKGSFETVSAQQLGKAGPAVAGMLEMYEAVQQKIISEEQFKAMCMLFFKLDEQDADDLLENMPEPPEPPPPAPPGPTVMPASGGTLVHPPAKPGGKPGIVPIPPVPQLPPMPKVPGTKGAKPVNAPVAEAATNTENYNPFHDQRGLFSASDAESATHEAYKVTQSLTKMSYGTIAGMRAKNAATSARNLVEEGLHPSGVSPDVSTGQLTGTRQDVVSHHETAAAAHRQLAAESGSKNIAAVHERAATLHDRAASLHKSQPAFTQSPMGYTAPKDVVSGIGTRAGTTRPEGAIARNDELVTHGGSGSGFFGHGGRPGEVGGSSSEGGGSKESWSSPLGRAEGSTTAFVGSPHNPNAGDTQSAFKLPSGNYTPERAAIHEKIINDILKAGVPSDKPVAVILGGGPGAGKTTLRDSGLLGLPDKVTTVAGDEIKTKLPEYSNGVASNDKAIAGLVHEESTDITAQALKGAVSAKQNLVFDGTGDSSLAKLSAKIDGLRASGHQIVAHYVTISTKDALARAQHRLETTGRGLSAGVVKSGHVGVSAVFPQALKAGLYDKATLWDNSGKTPVKVLSHENGKTTIHEPKLYQAFLDKAKG